MKKIYYKFLMWLCSPLMKRHYGKWYKFQFSLLPHRGLFDHYVGELRSIVIIPRKHVHDSGYRCMDFVAIDKHDNPICRLSGCSDVIHLDGIGGFGKNWTKKDNQMIVDAKGWSMDSLRVSGYLRLFASQRTITAGPALSSFEVYAD